MHKITKGLKKKKKDKKHKRKEDEIFKPEELENYRKQHQGGSEEPTTQNEEWKQFLNLTSGVDDILKKTQGDLDRIKSTSFFQRKPTESQVKKQEILAEEKQKAEAAAIKEAEPPTATELGIVEVSESESEEEDDDNLFDTAYIEALEAADVKLAYIPESPTDKVDGGEDPFDTSYAEKVILGPGVQRKGKRLVPLGAAVEVLTGRVELPTCATRGRPAPRRQILQEQNLLLGSFDENAGAGAASNTDGAWQEAPKTLLDEDPLDLVDQPIDLSNPIPYPQALPIVTDTKKVETETILEDDLEFEALAAESLSKTSVQRAPVVVEVVNNENINFGAFEEEPKIEDDPFDTTFVEGNIPVVVNKKLPNLENKKPPRPPVVPVYKTDIVNDQHSEIPGGAEVIRTSDSSLAGNKNSNLQSSSKSAKVVINFEDDSFDPRAPEEYGERKASRPDVLNIFNSKTVSFDLPSPDHHAGVESKIIKPLTPFYTRKSSIPELPISDDPFDTSFASNVAPGKAELRIIESELFDPNVEKNLHLVDKNFNPRDETRSKIDKVVETINQISNPKPVTSSVAVDLLATDNDIPVKVLTPGASIDKDAEEIIYRDPFDTSSFATDILPGRTELKLLENELIDSKKEKETEDLLVHNDYCIDTPLSPVAEVNVRSNFEEDEDFDIFDTSSYNDLQPGKAELKLIESEFI